MEGERKSVKQQPLSSAQATEYCRHSLINVMRRNIVDMRGDWAFVNPLPVGQSTRGESL